MRISFCYIEGISMVDTPYFDNIDDQTFFFERHEVGYVNTTFYPPHYRNSIRVDVSDFDFNSEINYVRFQYLNKWYYYFIDSIEYLNENVMVVNITMDVIQTYYSNIKVDSGVIERKFINRWTEDDKINRNYIRENHSNGLFQLVEKNDIDGYDANQYTIINKTTTVSKATVGSYAPVASSSAWLYINNQSVSNKYYIYVGHTKLTFTNSIRYQTSTGDILYGNVTVIGGLAESLELYVSPFVPVMDITVSNGIATCDTLNIHKENYNFDDMHGQSITYLYADIYRIKVYTYYRSLHTWFNPNKIRLIDTPYSSDSIYQMLDENYFMVEFGSLTASTVYPLYYLDAMRVYYHYWFNISDGTRIYLINDISNSIEDKYQTIVVDTNILYLDMMNNRWSEYVANNKNRWAQVTMGATTSALGVIGAISSRNANYTINDISESKSLGVSVRAGKGITGFDAKGSIKERNINKNVDSTDTYYNPSRGIGAVEQIYNQLLTENNIDNSPYHKKQSMSYGTSIMDTNAIIWERIKKVNDFEQCAQFYHRNGYRVDEYVCNLTEYNLWDHVFNRYYFNVLKMSNVEITLAEVVNDEETINLIKERLIHGIRLWNIAIVGSMLQDRFPIGTYQYDNVELDYIQ